VIAELVLAGIFGVIGLRSAMASLRETETGRSLRNRALVALHDAAKAGFWLALGAFFLGFGLLDEPQGFRWFALVPIGMAGIRLAAAAVLSRG
jgi:hypothetical protein